MIALIIIGFLLLVASFIWVVCLDNDNDIWIVPYFMFCLGMVMLIVGSIEVFSKQTEIRCMNGKYEYEQRVIYYNNDTIPVDTIYVKIK